ncbi:MAG TPA: CYTH domain-containing protein [Desulfomonilaceae bacterium]|nr:CYTH domain-containing protein [Desulfomonilaceae bacterium]
MNAGPANSIETEATLIVASDNPESILSLVGGITSIGEYAVDPSGDFSINDYYFDTPAGDLAGLRWAFRIRRVGGETRITLKGPSRKIQWGGVERSEIEMSWSFEAFEKAINMLSGHGLAVSLPHERVIADDPLSAVHATGLITIQMRETARTIRNVVAAGSDLTLAELLLDTVAYHFGHQVVRHHETEIEAKTTESASLVRTVAEYLLNLCPRELRVWFHSKLATGLAIETLLSSGRLKNLLRGPHLIPAAYDVIEKYLGENRPQGQAQSQCD